MMWMTVALLGRSLTYLRFDQGHPVWIHILEESSLKKKKTHTQRDAWWVQRGTDWRMLQPTGDAAKPVEVVELQGAYSTNDPLIQISGLSPN